MIAYTPEYKQLLTVAQHEAGHALMCVLLKRTFDCVTIKPDNGYVGAVLGLTDQGNERFLFQDALIFYAGLKSEELFSNSNLSVYNGAQPDFQQVNRLVEAMAPGNKLVAPIHQEIRETCSNLLVNNWQSLKKIADALVKKETLTYQEVKNIIK